MFELFPDQIELDQGITDAYARGARVVMPVLPTGGGKTVIVANRMARAKGASCTMAHRQELVGQISLAYARFEIPHRIIAPNPVIREIASIHSDELGSSRFIDPNARAGVGGVDTILNRFDQFRPWLESVQDVTIDEGHHVLEGNKWGKAFALFPNARGLFPTATPRRADRKGLGVHADGLVDELVQGATMRRLIDIGRLCEYKIICSQELAQDLSEVAVSKATGDFNEHQLRDWSKKRQNQIAGDVVKEYLRHARGKLGVTFTVDTETAAVVAASYRAAGVPAEVVTAKTPARARASILRQFRDRKLLQLVNVDIFGEGFDLPAIEVASFARPTKSFSLFTQQFGRALRVMPGKEYALIIDHVGNVLEHGLPDAPQVWTLDRGTSRPRKTATDAIPLRACDECSRPYESVLVSCPWCGNHYTPAARSSPELVAGDLVELDAAILAELRQDVEKNSEHPDDVKARVRRTAGDFAAQGAANRQREKLEAIAALKASMAFWAGYHSELGREPREVQKRFFHAFGVDSLSSQALKRAETITLADKINADIGRLQIEREGVANV
jgi:superfamily II DNA or RNA helicase